MADVVFLSLETVLELHRRSLLEHGGSFGVRDQGALESAVAQAKNDFFYGDADTFGIAAPYAFHIAEAQAFLDGNKRTAIAAALTYLELTAVDTATRDSDPLYDAMIAIARRELDKRAGWRSCSADCLLRQPAATSRRLPRRRR